MVFMFMFYGDEKAIASMSREDRNGLVERHVRYNHEILEKRVPVLATRGLEPTASAMTVRPAGGEVVVTEGPFATPREALLGFYLVDCRDMDEALELARLYPMPEGLGCVEVRPVMRTWDYAPSVDSAAPASGIWGLYSDVSTWPDWQAGVQHVELDGPFASGTTGRVTESGGPPRPFRIVAVRPGEGYTSETELAEDLLLRTEHELMPLPDGGTRITHRVTVPRAALDRFGLQFSPDLNDRMRTTLEALSEMAATEALPRRGARSWS